MTKSKLPLNDEGFANVPGGRIWYGVAGELGNGQTPLLVIHGGPGMAHNYLLPLADLANERAVIFYDQLDAGRSERPNDPANWNVPRFLQEIDVLREVLDLHTVSLFGNSWGGTLAAAYASSHPPGLEKAVLSSPLINTEKWIVDNNRYREALPDAVKAVMDACEAAGDDDAKEYEDAVKLFYERHLCRTTPWPDYLLQTFELMNVECYNGMWGPNEFTCNGVLVNYDGSEDLRSIDVPVLMTCGEFDEAAPASCREYVSLIAKAEFIEFAGASHLAFIEDRDNYITAVRKFLGRLTRKQDKRS